jgi:tetratricopeptide (TPR) repeat protein
MYYARAVQSAPEQPGYWADFGSYLFTIDKPKDALKAVRKAYALAPTDAEIVGQVAAVLRREGHAEEATTKVRSSLFHNHGAAAFQQLWQTHQFQLLHARQQTAKAEAIIDDDVVILPFEPATGQGKYVELGAKTFRIDQAEPLAEPTKKEPLPFRRPPRKG